MCVDMCGDMCMGVCIDDSSTSGRQSSSAKTAGMSHVCRRLLSNGTVTVQRLLSDYIVTLQRVLSDRTVPVQRLLGCCTVTVTYNCITVGLCCHCAVTVRMHVYVYVRAHVHTRCQCTCCQVLPQQCHAYTKLKIVVQCQDVDTCVGMRIDMCTDMPACI